MEISTNQKPNNNTFNQMIVGDMGFDAQDEAILALAELMCRTKLRQMSVVGMGGVSTSLISAGQFQIERLG